MNARLPVGLLLLAALLPAQDRRLPLEDILRQKAGHFRISAAWIGGGIYDLKFPTGFNTTTPAVRAYSGSAGASLNWTYLGNRTSGWANYSGDYSMASRSSLDSLSQTANSGFTRRVTPRFSLGMVGTFQQSNIGARLFQSPQQAQDLQSSNFNSGATGGLGASTDPIGETISAIPGTGPYGLLIGGNQRQYTIGLASSFTFSSRTDLRLSASAGQGEILSTPGVTTQLPYGKARAGYVLGTLRHQATQRTTLSWQMQFQQTRAQQERINAVSTMFGLGYRLSRGWRLDLGGGAGASTVFRQGQIVPWVFQYTDLVRLTYGSTRQAFVTSFTQDAGDRVAFGFQSTTLLNFFWNYRPRASGWALSARTGGALLRLEGLPSTKAGTVQLGLSRHLFGDIYAFAEASYVTNVLFAQQRLLQQGSTSSPVDTTAQRGLRLSIVYRPTPERK